MKLKARLFGIALWLALVFGGIAPAQYAPYPGGLAPVGGMAQPVTGAATGTTGAVTATLAGVAGKTTYLCGYTVTANATAGTSGTGTLGGTGLSFAQGVAVSPAVAVTSQTLAPCLPATSPGTAITVNSIAAGTGGNTTVSAWGYQL